MSQYYDLIERVARAAAELIAANDEMQLAAEDPSPSLVYLATVLKYKTAFKKLNTTVGEYLAYLAG